MKHFARSILRRCGYDVVRYTPGILDEVNSVADLSEPEKRIVSAARPFTMTSIPRLVALVNAVTHVARNRVPGDLAECGVWRGGSMMAAALTLLAHGDRSRSLYLYDTFEGMPAPASDDKSFDGVPAEDQLRQTPKGTGVWCSASIEDVRANLLSTGYPEDKIHLIKGKVEDTIPAVLPQSLSVLRLDTDWHESTRHELVQLYPLLQARGVLIIDDYGHWQGARKAVDEYFQGRGAEVYLHRIDYTGRLLIKTGA